MKALALPPVPAALVVHGHLRVVTFDEAPPPELVGTRLPVWSLDEEPVDEGVVGDWAIAHGHYGWSGWYLIAPDNQTTYDLYPGAVVGSCEISEAVPIVTREDPEYDTTERDFIAYFAKPADPALRTLTLVRRGQTPVWTDIEQFRPYADWSPTATCPTCGGLGEGTMGDTIIVCPTCGDGTAGGSGTVQRFAWLIEDGKPTTAEDGCPVCEGKACPDCGSGDRSIPIRFRTHGPFCNNDFHSSPACSTCDDRGSCDPLPARVVSGEGPIKEVEIHHA